MAFKDPIDEEADAAEGRVVGNHAGKLAERMSAAQEEDTEEIPVEAPEPDEPDEDAVVETRKDRRASRTTARERVAAAEARADALKEALSLRGAERAEPQAQPQAPDTAGVDAAIRKNYADQETLHDEYDRAVRAAGKNGLSRDEEKRFKDRAIDLDVENKTLVADRRDAIRAPQRESERKLAEIKSNHGDVFAHPAALRYAQAAWNQRMARGEADTKDAVDASFEEARQVVMGKRPKPDAAQRQRASGIGVGARAGGAIESGAKISMPKGSPLYRMALAQYPDLEPAQACQKWAQRNGKGKAYLEATGKR